MPAALLLLLAVLPLSAAAAVPQAPEAWLNVFAQGRVLPPGATHARALYYLEFQPRFGLSPARADKVLLRGAVGWEVTRGVTLWAGVGAIPRFDGSDWLVSETRLWQQLMLSGSLGPQFQGLLRLRLEERAFENAPELSWRARLMLRGVYTPPAGGNTTWGLVVFDEYFHGVAGVEGKQGFDQNRAFAGVLHRFTPWMSVEAGYLNVYSRLPSEKMAHTFLVQTIFNLL
ncbi:MAG: hypothetical protein RL653_2131 [Pseudomonadota bacterium]